MDAKDAPQIIEHVSKSVGFTPFETRWIPCSARFTVLGVNSRGQGVLRIYELGRTDLELVSETLHDHGFKCGTFGASSFESRQLATGGFDGGLRIFDLADTAKPVYDVAAAHAKRVNCIDGVGGLGVGYGAPELVTGSEDGTVRVWDPRQQESVASLEPAPGQAARDCWAVAFGNSFNESERMVAAGYDNGDVKLLDLRMNALVWQTNVSNGVAGLEFDRKDIEANKLVIATLENRFRVYDMRTRHPEEGYAHLSEKAHNSTVWLGRHLPQNRDLFATTGGNGTVNVYKYKYPKQRSRKDEKGVEKGVAGSVELLNSKKLAEQPIVSLDWHPDKLGLACMAALDETVKVAIVTKLNNY